MNDHFSKVGARNIEQFRLSGHDEPLRNICAEIGNELRAMIDEINKIWDEVVIFYAIMLL